MTNRDTSRLDALMTWYQAQCDGDWEHEYGIHLGTLDNPGWSLQVDLAGTALAGKSIPSKLTERSDDDWVAVEVKEDSFRAAGGVRNLVEVIDLFLAFVEGRLPP